MPQRTRSKGVIDPKWYSLGGWRTVEVMTTIRATDNTAVRTFTENVAPQENAEERTVADSTGGEQCEEPTHESPDPFVVQAAREVVQFGLNPGNYIKDKLQGLFGGNDEAEACEAASGSSPTSIEDSERFSLEDGVLTFHGTDEPEDITLRRNGDQIELSYRLYDDENNELARETHTIDASDVDEVRVYAAGGNDVIRNFGVDGAYLSAGGGQDAGGDLNRVTNYADDVTIAMGSYAAQGVVNNHGDGSVIQGTPGADAVWSEGDGVSFDLGGGDSLINLGQGATIMLRPSEDGVGASVTSIGDGTEIDAENGTADEGVLIGEDLTVYSDGFDTGTVATPAEVGVEGWSLQEIADALGLPGPSEVPEKP